MRARRVPCARRAQRRRQVHARRDPDRSLEARPRLGSALRRARARPRRPLGLAGAVACVYQRSMVIPSLSVAENIFLNRSDRSLVRWRDLRRQARRLLLHWGFDLDVDAMAAQLSVEEKQIVEIARALSIGARFLILDEPTASLESHAVERLFERVRRMKASGVAILYISHHLEEIYEICDTTTVLRDGRHIVTAPVAELDHERLVAAMVGADLARASREQARSSPRARTAGSLSRALRSDAARLGRGREPRRGRRRVPRPVRPARLGHRSDRRRGCRAREAGLRDDRARRRAAQRRARRPPPSSVGRLRAGGPARARLRARRSASPRT